MYQEFKDLLSAFRAHGARYLIVGGYAVIFHAQPRTTKDIDLLIQVDPANAKAVYAALASFGLPLGEIRAKILRTEGAFFASDASRVRLIFSRKFQALILSRRGNAGSKASSILQQG